MTAVVPGTGVLGGAGTAPSRSSRVRRAMGTAVLLLSLAVLAGTALLPDLGLRLLAVQSGSMAPEMPQGALLLEEQVAVTDLQPGMVLSYYPPTEEQRLVTHRVVSVDRTRGGTIVETRGDANPGKDPWEAELLDQRVWVATASLPVAGQLADVVRSPLALVLATVLLPVVFAVSTLRLIWRRGGDAGLRLPVGRHRAGRVGGVPCALLSAVPRTDRPVPARPGRRTAGALLAGALALGAVLGSATPAQAAFSTSISRGHTVASAALLAPAVVAAGNCQLLGSTVQVSWTPVSTGEDRYRIERRVNAGAWTTLATVPSTTKTYSDAAVTYLTNYTYRVTALRGTWTSPIGATPTATLAATCR